MYFGVKISLGLEDFPRTPPLLPCQLYFPTFRVGRLNGIRFGHPTLCLLFGVCFCDVINSCHGLLVRGRKCQWRLEFSCFVVCRFLLL